MKFILPPVVFFAISAIFSSFNSRFTDHDLGIYFMKSFDNDSVKISTQNHEMSLRATGITSLVDTTPQLVLPITTGDSTISIHDVINDNSYTVRYKHPYKYLFIYYNREKFTFRFANKLLYVE